MTRVRWTLLTLLALALVKTPLAWGLAKLLPDPLVAVEVNCAVMIAQSLLLFALPGLLLSCRADRDAEGGERCRSWTRLTLWLAVGSALAVLARGTASPLNDWWSGLLGLTGDSVPLAQGWAGLLQILAYAAVPAVAEELFFRGALLRNLRTCCGDMTSVLLTTAMFALMHGSLAGLMGHLLTGLLLSLLMVHGGNVLVPISAHLAYNLLALCWPQTLAVVPWLCGCAVVAVIGALMHRLPGGQERRMPKQEWLLCGVALLTLAMQYLMF